MRSSNSTQVARWYLAIVSTAATSTGINAEAIPTYLSADAPIESRVEDLLGRMTLAEKIGQMTQIERDAARNHLNELRDLGIGSVLSGGGQYPHPNTPLAWANMVDQIQSFALASRLKIPLIYGVDAVHGHAAMKGAVVFPHNIGLGAANDPELVEKIARITAFEVRASGVHWNFAPMVGMALDARWGRTYESYAQDTEILKSLGTAYVRGLQNSAFGGLKNPLSALASVKHFIGDGAARFGTSPFGKNHIDRGEATISEATLRSEHLPPYIEAIKAGARNLMVSYSSWGGLKMHAHKYLLTDVLKGELGFSGFLISDYMALNELPGANYEEQITQSINAGLDMIMVPTDFNRFLTNLKSALAKGAIQESRIDDAVRRILRVKFELGLFEAPYTDRRHLGYIGSLAHRRVAREAVAKSLVALKNKNQALPLSANLEQIFVSGRGADNLGVQSGGWTLEWQGVYGNHFPGTSFLWALRSSVRPGTQIHYNEQGYFPGNTTRAQVGFVVLGETPYAEMRGDRPNLELSWEDKALVERVKQKADKVIVILFSGRPLILGEVLEQADAVVAAFLPGSEGLGITDVLLGAKPFHGKLSFPWPKSMAYFHNIDQDLPEDPLTVAFPKGFGL